MTLAWADLERAIKRDNAERVAELVRGATEKERQACAKPLLDGQDRFVRNRRYRSFGLAVLGCVTGHKQAAGSLRFVPFDDVVDLAVEILADRKPHWLPGFASELTKVDHGRSEWALARALVSTGLSDRPDHVAYIEALVRRAGWQWASLARGLREEPDLLEHEVWRFFEIEGLSSLLMGQESDPPVARRGGWSAALADLADEGRIERGRLLDAALGALLRDFKPSQVSWYLRMHDALDPTVEEMAERQPTYRRVLATDASVAVGLAQRCLARLLKEKRLDIEAWLEAAEPPLHRKEKNVVVAQLRMIETVGKEHPHVVAPVVLRALGHERSDVQERALKLLGKLPPEALERLDPEHVADAVADVAPALRTEAARILGTDDDRPVTKPAEPASSPGRWPRVEPVRDVDALAEVLSRALEQIDDPLDFERCLDGVAWAARTGIEPSRLSAAVGRARQQSKQWPGPFGHGQPAATVAGLLVSWADRTSFRPPHPDLRRQNGLLGRALDRRPDFTGHRRPPWLGLFPLARAYELSVQLATGRPTTVLAFPTDASGAVSAAAFAARCTEAADADLDLMPIDTAQAVLRLDPAVRQAAPDAATEKGRRVVADVLEQHPPLPAVRLTTLAARPRTKWGDMTSYDIVLVQGEPATQPTLDDPVSLLCALGHPFADFPTRVEELQWTTIYGSLAACMPLVAPHHPELVWAHVHFPMSSAIEMPRAVVQPFLLRLLADPAPMGPLATQVVVLALGAAGPEARALAAEVTAGAAAHGRLDTRALGSFLGTLLGTTLKANRVVASLRDASTISPAGAHAVLDALEEAIPQAVDARGVGDLLGLAADLVAELGRAWTDTDALRPILDKGGSSRAAKEARRLARPA